MRGSLSLTKSHIAFKVAHVEFRNQLILNIVVEREPSINEQLDEGCVVFHETCFNYICHVLFLQQQKIDHSYLFKSMPSTLMQLAQS